MILLSDFSLTSNTFDSVESAVRAKESLNGADIYSGCCTLKIDFAKVSDICLNFLVTSFKVAGRFDLSRM